MAEALRLWAAVERPESDGQGAGDAGRHARDPAADRQGLNINVTLLFSRRRLREGGRSLYRRARRVCSEGRRRHLARSASVASFFVSRIDAAVDKKLDTSIARSTASCGTQLRGKVAIANAKLAYAALQDAFLRRRAGRRSAARRARPSALLWAAPAPRTRPTATALCRGADRPRHRQHHAAGDHGRLPRPWQREADAIETRHRRGASAIAGRRWPQPASRSNEVTEELVDGRREAVRRRLRQAARRGREAAPQAARRRRAAPSSASALRTRCKQPSTRRWKPGARTAHPAALGRRHVALDRDADEDQWLGWLDIVEQELDDVATIAGLRRAGQAAGFTDVVLLGMGGSSLGPEVLAETFGRSRAGQASTCSTAPIPRRSTSLEQAIDLGKTLFIVSSKSGSTLEPNIFKEYFFDRVGAVRRRGQGRRAIRRRHRSRLVAGAAGRSRPASATSSTACPRSAAAIPCCRISAWCRRRRSASTSSAFSRRTLRDGARLRRRRAAGREPRRAARRSPWASRPRTSAATR